MLNNLLDRIKLPFRKEKELYFALYDILGFYPHNIAYYKVALMHKSLGHRATEKELRLLDNISNGKGRKGKGKAKDARGKRNGRKDNRLGKRLNNERLEFLGDAILDAVVGDEVYRRFSGKSEGFLTNARSKMVQRETLGKLAQQMGITRLIMASGRSASHNNYMGGNAFEALVGAAYLDRGYEACQKFWRERVMGKYLNVDKVAYTEVNFKSKILEWAQKNRVNLDFRLEDQSQDKNGSPTFVYTVVIEGVDGCKAEGFSKKESQQHACEQTLKKLRSDGKFLDSIFAAKTARTQMEETPVSVAPDVEQESDALMVQADTDINGNQTDALETMDNVSGTETKSAAEEAIDALSMDDIETVPRAKTKEELIAEAEEAAYRL